MAEPLRDIDTDRKLLHNQGRAVTIEFFPTKRALSQMITRWVIALALGLLIGGVELLILYTLISLHQIIYELWAKPSAKDYPRINFFIIAPNVGFRFIAGVMTIAGAMWSLLPFLLIASLSYLVSMGSMAMLWRIEAEDYVEKNELTEEDHIKRELTENLRPQSYWYRKHGEYWQHLGLVSAVILGGLIILGHVLASNIFSNYPYDGQFSLWKSLALVILLVIFAMLTAGAILRLLRRVKQPIIRFIEWIRGIATPVLWLLFYSGLVITALYGNILILLFSFWVLALAHLIMFEGITYEEYSLAKLKRGLPKIGRDLYSFLFTRHGPSLKKLIDEIRAAL